mgnify:CR=1 FL=1
MEEWQLWVLYRKYQTGNELNHKQSDKQTLSIKTLKNIRIVLNLILKNAELKQQIGRNPLDLVKVPKKSKKGNKPISFLSLRILIAFFEIFSGFASF